MTIENKEYSKLIEALRQKVFGSSGFGMVEDPLHTRAADAIEELMGSLNTSRACTRERDAKVAELSSALSKAISWTNNDKRLPEDIHIQAAHPLNTSDYKRYSEAQRMVGAKRSKYALIDLVNWVMHDRDEFADGMRKATQKYDAQRTHAMKLQQKADAMTAYIAGEPIEVARPGYDDPLVWRPWIANTSTSRPLFDGPCIFRRAALAKNPFRTGSSEGGANRLPRTPASKQGDAGVAASPVRDGVLTEELVRALYRLYAEDVDYLRVNHLSGYNNRSMVMARTALHARGCFNTMQDAKLCEVCGGDILPDNSLDKQGHRPLGAPPRPEDWAPMRHQMSAIEIDAARWRALVGCARVRMIGHAGLTPGSPFAPFELPYAHIGVEFWTVHDAPPADSNASRVILTLFADKARGAINQPEIGRLP